MTISVFLTFVDHEPSPVQILFPEDKILSAVSHVPELFRELESTITLIIIKKFILTFLLIFLSSKKGPTDKL